MIFGHGPDRRGWKACFRFRAWHRIAECSSEQRSRSSWESALQQTSSSAEPNLRRVFLDATDIGPENADALRPVNSRFPMMRKAPALYELTPL